MEGASKPEPAPAEAAAFICAVRYEVRDVADAAATVVGVVVVEVDKLNEGTVPLAGTGVRVGVSLRLDVDAATALWVNTLNGSAGGKGGMRKTVSEPGGMVASEVVVVVMLPEQGRNPTPT